MDTSVWDSMCEYSEGAFEALVAELLAHSYQRSVAELTTTGRIFSVVVGFAGSRRGRIIVTANDAAVRAMTTDMNFGEALESLEEQGLYLAEFTNMLGGRIITCLNNVFGVNLRLTPPAIFSGTNLKMQTPNMRNKKQWYQNIDAVVSVDLGIEGV